MAGPVMVGVDGSEGSRAALRWASTFAARTGRVLVAVHGWRLPASSGIDPIWPVPSDPEQIDARIERSLRRICTEEIEDSSGEIRVAAVRGDAAGSLVEEARREGASLLVVGSRGLGGFRSLMLGSVGRTVLDHAPCPVAVVRNETRLDGGGPLLVAVDGSDAAEQAMAWAAGTGRALGAPVLLVRAHEPPPPGLSPRIDHELRLDAQAQLERSASRLEGAGVATQATMLEGDPREVLMEATVRERPRIVVAGTRGTKRAGALLGSVASHLAHHVPGVLVLVPPTRP
jgi:nucleotide-binding universal stress UspA family protein